MLAMLGFSLCFSIFVLYLFSVQFYVSFCETLGDSDDDVFYFNYDDADDNALYLTPLLEENKVSEAQERSRVKPDIANTTCFTGYLTVNHECKSNLFFWFCQAQTEWEEAPVLLWLQGGPGTSSLMGLFMEIGPFELKDGIPMKRKLTWNANNNLLFIDQPVGTGFSFTDKGCYAKDKNDIAKDLYSAIFQFYQLFPNLRVNPFYIAGESYAGHYIPYIGHFIHDVNPTAKFEINLKGMMIGNGWMDAYYQYDYSDFLYHIGLIDEKENETHHQHLLQLRKHMDTSEWSNAASVSWKLEKISPVLDGINVYNFIQDKVDSPPYDSFLNLTHLRKHINIGSRKFCYSSSKVFFNLASITIYDAIRSAKPEIEDLLEHYPMVFYFGQLDAVCPYSSALAFLRQLRWSGAADYEHASRRMWCVDGRLAGFTRSSHNLHEVLVRSAGHSVPIDQPLRAFLLADSVTSSPPDDPLAKLTHC